MWRIDQQGSDLDGPGHAREALRSRARLAINAGLMRGDDIGGIRVRLRDGAGTVLFDGTMTEAAAGHSSFAERPTAAAQHASLEIDDLNPKVNRRRREAAELRRRCSHAIADLKAELLRSQKLMAEARSYCTLTDEPRPEPILRAVHPGSAITLPTKP